MTANMPNQPVAPHDTNRSYWHDLMILDELHYLVFSQAGGTLPFNLISALYEKTSIITTTNLTFSE